MTKITQEVVEELESIRQKNHGKLRPADALSVAEKKGTKSPIYNMLAEKNLWDDSEAAHYGRLEFVRNVIVRVRIRITGESGRPQNIRAYVSPIEERQHGGGYVSVREILNDDSRKRELLDTAMRELKAFQRKYRDLQELFGIFEEIDTITDTITEAAA